jgi:16S rRNA (uracil1498-N3)-methyltransferase
MNIVLFEHDEIDRRLPLADERARHIIGVLRRSPGDTFDAGIIDGLRGKGTLIGEHADGLEIEFECGEEEPPLPPIDLVVGLSRPQTNRKILQEATTLGVRSMSFVTTERGEPSYAESRLWSTGEWRRHLIAGAAQAFTTRLPRVAFRIGLKESISASIADASGETSRVVLDNYESPRSLATSLNNPTEVLVAVGAERGWTADERDLFRELGFGFAHLGTRPLRTETAVIAAIAIVHASMEA